MDVPAVAGIEELESHIQLLTETPDTPLNSKLFDDVELQLTEVNTIPLIPRLLPSLINLLTITPHQPDHIVSLSIRLLRPVTFTQAMTMATPESLTLALQSPATSTVLLALTVVQKASRTPSEAAILANMPTLVSQLIITWLSNPSVEVGESATRALAQLFETDCTVSSSSSSTLNLEMNGNKVALRPQTGMGLFWRRVFDGNEIFLSIFNLCSAPSRNHDNVAQILDERQRSLAQARLLRLLPTLAALDLHTLAHARSSRITGSGGIAHPAEQGLLYFAILGMIDKSDILMHITLVDFVRELLETLAPLTLGHGEEEYLKLLMGDAMEGDEAIKELVKELRGSVRSQEELVGLLERLRLGI